MELADYLRVLRRRWWMLLLAVVVCTAGAGAASYAKAPSYTTTTRLLISGGQTDEDAVDEIARRQLASQRATAYAQLVDTGPADAAAVRQADAVGTNVSTTAAADGTSPFITITVVAGSAQVAQAVANAYVVVLPAVIKQLEQTPSSVSPNITTLEAAPLPAKPTSPNPPRDILVGLVLGLVLGIAGALVREALDARIRDTTELEKLYEGMLLGSVPREGGDPLVARTRPRSARAEAYRHIRTNLEFTGPGGLPSSIVVTSPAPGDGKSSLSANLAIVAARSGRNVVLVDADLRKPSVAKYFGLQKSAYGLAEVLAGQVSLSDAVVQVEGERLWVLPSGAVPKYPSELVGSATMAEVIQNLEQYFDLVVIDTPPVLPVSDALVMGVNAGGVVLVARMGETKRGALKRAVQTVQKVDANLLGIVANAVVLREEKAYGNGYGYAYGKYTSNRKEAESPLPELEPARRRSSGRHSDEPAAQPAPAAGAPAQRQSTPAYRPPAQSPSPQGWPGHPDDGPTTTIFNGYETPPNGQRNGYANWQQTNGHQTNGHQTNGHPVKDNGRTGNRRQPEPESTFDDFFRPQS